MSEEQQARFEVLLENIQSSVKVIAEGHGALTDRFDGLNDRLDRIETKVDNVDAKVVVLTSRVKRIEHHLGLNGTAPPKRKK